MIRSINNNAGSTGDGRLNSPFNTLAAFKAGNGDQSSPTGNTWGATPSGANPYIAPASGSLSPQSLAVSGGSLPHNNLQPYLTLNFCIALQGVFPPRS